MSAVATRSGLMTSVLTFFGSFEFTLASAGGPGSIAKCPCGAHDREADYRCNDGDDSPAPFGRRLVVSLVQHLIVVAIIAGVVVVLRHRDVAGAGVRFIGLGIVRRRHRWP